EIDFEKSILIWDFLIRDLNLFYPEEKECIYANNYKWFEYNQYSQKFSGKLFEILKTNNWLLGKENEELNQPKEISFQDLHEEYETESKSSLLLEDILNFKPDEIKEIEERTGGVFISKDEFQEFQNWKKEQEEVDSQVVDFSMSEEEYQPFDIEPDGVDEIISYEYFSKKRPQEDLSYQNYFNNSNHNETKKVFKKSKQLSGERRKQIGDWGESFVNKHLQERYKNSSNIKVHWLNTNGSIGKGYDFVILENGIEIEYIEVKSKMGSNISQVEISKTQWDWAKEKGKKFSLYIVSNVGKKEARIETVKDPYLQWVEGKIKATPISLEL
ncbi:MAG: DUF3883 domain-containing protein, partial [Campylobacterales bacterium]|nr:DUF3883 domain-containing protein [Campylobacterales bacterium]